jgi:hypothetical protein
MRNDMLNLPSSEDEQVKRKLTNMYSESSFNEDDSDDDDLSEHSIKKRRNRRK